ncbi:MAG: glycosyl transferase [Devosia sp.]|nr:glycosyl transferase [Devosia sp.]
MSHSNENRSIKPHSVAVALLTNNRPNDLSRVLAALASQSVPLGDIIVVDTGATPAAEEICSRHAQVRYVSSHSNLGGAGGFSLAMLLAIATGAEHIWIMDDDACPEGRDCLQTLLAAMPHQGLQAVSPIIVAPTDPSRLAFPYPNKGAPTYDRKQIEQTPFLPSFAQLFNGLLIHKDVFFVVGLPDMKLFIRGDEVDFLLRMRQAGIQFGTVTGAAMSHPPGWGEVNKVTKRMQALVPEGDFKRYYFFRNRGYLARRHRRIRSFLVDLVGYPLVFIVVRRGDISGLRQWWSAFWDGLNYRFGPPR